MQPELNEMSEEAIDRMIKELQDQYEKEYIKKLVSNNPEEEIGQYPDNQFLRKRALEKIRMMAQQERQFK